MKVNTSRRQSILSPSSQSSARSRGTTDASYVSSLKDQIKFLELECHVLKGRSGKRNVRHEVVTGVDSLDDSIAALTTRCKNMEAEHKLELGYRDTELTRLKNEIIAGRIELEALREEFELIKGRADDEIEVITRGMEKDYATLANSYALGQGLEERIRNLEMDLSGSQSEFEKARIECAKSESVLKLERDQLQLNLNNAEEVLRSVKSRITVDKLRLEKLEVDHQDFESAKKHFETQANASVARADALRSELAYCRTVLNRVQESETNLLQENKDLIESNAGLSEQLRVAKNKLAEYASREDTAQRERNIALETAASQEVGYQAIKIQLEQSLRQVDDAQVAQRKEAVGNAAYRARIQDLTSRNEATNERLGLEHLKYVEAHDHASKLLAQVSFLRNKLEFCEAQNIQQQERVVNAKKAQQIAEDQFARVQNQLEIQKDIENLNIGELQTVMENNLKLSAQFNVFLQKHATANSEH